LFFGTACGVVLEGGDVTDIDDLLAMSRRELMHELRRGHPIDPSQLDDSEYRGISLGLPRFVERLTWKKFKKVFHRDPSSGVLRGWNVRIEQDGLDRPWVPMMRDGEPRTFGHFCVVPSNGHAPAGCEAALLLDYGSAGNGRLDPVRPLRDPVVAVHAGRCDLLLGWSYVDLGFAKVGTPSFFSLERDGPLSHVASAPRH